VKAVDPLTVRAPRSFSKACGAPRFLPLALVVVACAASSSAQRGDVGAPVAAAAPIANSGSPEILTGTVGSPAPEPLEPSRPEDVEALRALLPELAKERSRTVDLTAEFLERLALALERAAPRSAEHDKQLGEIRFQAKRLRRSDPLAFDKAGWIKQGLLAAIQQLEAFASCPALATWMTTARVATEALDERGALGFQRAALQNALVTITDVMAIRTQFKPCATKVGEASPSPR
jgi:hypothetical protein